MKAFKIIAAGAAILALSSFGASAGTCAVYRNGILVHVYCAIVPPVVDVIGAIIALPERVIFGDGAYSDDETVVYDRQTTRRKYYGPAAPLK